MDDVTDDAKGGGYRRIEVLTGPGRRRVWSDDDKARIVAETLRPGAVVTEVARRWQISPQQLFDWRRQARRAAQEATSATALEFVPVVPPAMPPSSPGPPIQVKLAGAVLRIAPGTDAALLTMVLRAIKGSAA
jgi:transposase